MLVNYNISHIYLCRASKYEKPTDLIMTTDIIPHRLLYPIKERVLEIDEETDV